MIPFWLPFELAPLLGAASMAAASLLWFLTGGVRS